MAELLIKAQSANHADATKDRRGCYKRGMPVCIMPDGWSWGTEETLPKFVIIKIPLITVAQVQKYIAQQYETITGPEGGPVEVIYRRRRWIIRWADLPAAAQNKLATVGQLIIKATAAYGGSFDYTWAQVKQYFRDQLNNVDETADL